jgi:hypothetical protein
MIFTMTCMIFTMQMVNLNELRSLVQSINDGAGHCRAALVRPMDSLNGGRIG